MTIRILINQPHCESGKEVLRWVAAGRIKGGEISKLSSSSMGTTQEEETARGACTSHVKKPKVEQKTG